MCEALLRIDRTFDSQHSEFGAPEGGGGEKSVFSKKAVKPSIIILPTNGERCENPDLSRSAVAGSNGKRAPLPGDVINWPPPFDGQPFCVLSFCQSTVGPVTR